MRQRHGRRDHHARVFAVEVPIGPNSGIDGASVVNGDGIHTVSQRRLTRQIGVADNELIAGIYAAIEVALACDEP